MNCRLAFVSKTFLVLVTALSISQTLHAAVGRTDGQPNVSAGGEATYSIPIKTPPGINGLTPELALSYGHRNTEGKAGVGWGITGLSQISRCAKTIGQDGVTDGVDLETTDRLCVDGVQLKVTSGTNGVAGSTYRSEVDNITRYTAYGSSGNGPTYFKAEAKNGLIYYYGNTSDSRIESLSTGYTTTALVWNLNKISDRNGNDIDFTYQEDGAPDGEYRIATVTYGGNTWQGLTARYEIEFSYGLLVAGNYHKNYVAGGKLYEFNQLSDIHVYYTGTGQAEMYRSYALDYDYSTSSAGKSRLDTVTECAKTTNICYSPTTFTYTNGTLGMDAAVSASTIPAGSKALSIDINGDGNMDLAYASGGYWRYRLALPNDGYEITEVTTAFSSVNHTEAVPIDFNADGFEDILVPNSSGYWSIIFGSANGLDAPGGVPFQTSAPDYSTPGNATALDMNGDGRDDLVWGENVGTFVNSKIKVRYFDNTTNNFSTTVITLFTGTSNINLVGPTLFSSVFVQDRHDFFDANGDGLADLAYITVRYSGPRFDPIETYYTDVVLGGWQGTFGVMTGFSPPLKGYSIDVNGDGYTDIAYRNQGGNLVHRLSTGKSFAPVVFSQSLSGLDYNKAAVLDWNSDGMQDLLIPDATDNVWQYIQSDGDTLKAKVATAVSSSGVTSPRRIDKNGDGLDDLAVVQNGTFKSRRHAGSYPDLLQTATDGFGNAITFNYTTITEGAYVKDATATYPSQVYIGPMQVVEFTVQSTGIGNNTYTTTYLFKNALLNLQGRGIGGFEYREITDSRNTIKRVEKYKRKYPHRGRLEEVTVQQADGKPIQQVTYSWDSVVGTLGAGDYEYPYADQILEKNYEVGGIYNGALVSEKTTTIEVDGNGTPTVIETVTTESASANGLQPGTTYSNRIEHTLIDSTSNWCLGKPTNTQWINTHSLGSGGTITRTMDRVWDTSYACRLNSEITEPGSGLYKVTRTLGYDVFGNVSSDATTGINMAARTTTLNWGSNGQFPTTITNAEGEASSYVWDSALGVRSSTTDPNGLTISSNHDEFGRLTRETNVDGTYTDYTLTPCAPPDSCDTSYDRANSQLHIARMDTNGSLIRFDDVFLDKQDRQVQTTQQVLGGGLSHTRTIYDDHGRIEQQSTPDFSSTPSHYVDTNYDVVGRPTSISRPIDASNPTMQSTTIDYFGLTVVTTDAEGKTATKVSDVKGRIYQSSDQDGYFQEFDFDAFGSVVKVRDSNTNVLFEASYAYGVGPLRVSSTDMDLGAWSYAPNALGELVSYSDAKSQAFTATFDKLSRPKTRVEPGNTTTWNYGSSAANNNIGRLISVSNNGHSESFAFDSYGRISKRTTTADTTYETDFGYDNTSGLLSSYTFPKSTNGVREKLLYSYQNGSLDQISDFASPANHYWTAGSVDARGNVIDETLENGLQSVRGYDAVTGLLDYIQTGTGGSQQNLAYSWNKIGSVTEREDQNRTLTESFFYDNLHRLDYSELDDGQSTVQNLDLSYDDLGNITYKSDVGPSAWSYDPDRKHAVINASGNTFEYDANGNQTKRNNDDVEWTSYNYPSKIENGTREHEFFYDGSRRRWKQTYNNGSSTETTIYVGRDFEKRTEGTISYFRHYLYADGRLVAIKERAEDAGTEISNENKSVLTDHLGSVVEVLNASGQLAASEQFAAFGERRQAGTAMADLTGKGFNGHTQLESSALVHMGGRVMDAALGRFLSPDPNIPDAGSTQSFNRFSYLQNNPLSGIDPSGFSEEWFQWHISVSWGNSSRSVKPKPKKGCINASAKSCWGKPSITTQPHVKSDVVSDVARTTRNAAVVIKASSVGVTEVAGMVLNTGVLDSKNIAGTVLVTGISAEQVTRIAKRVLPGLDGINIVTAAMQSERELGKEVFVTAASAIGGAVGEAIAGPPGAVIGAAAVGEIANACDVCLQTAGDISVAGHQTARGAGRAVASPIRRAQGFGNSEIQKLFDKTMSCTQNIDNC